VASNKAWGGLYEISSCLLRGFGFRGGTLDIQARSDTGKRSGNVFPHFWLVVTDLARPGRATLRCVSASSRAPILGQFPAASATSVWFDLACPAANPITISTAAAFFVVISAKSRLPWSQTTASELRHNECSPFHHEGLGIQAMKRTFYFAIVILGFVIPLSVYAQTDDAPVPLGDLARSLRKSKTPEPAPATIIDNENLTQVMQQVQIKRLDGSPVFSIDNASKDFKVTTPDGTCSLSFNANSTALLSVPYVSQDLPESEIAKLDGPAIIDGNSLQVSVHNGSAWNVKEITVGLTIVRHDDAAATAQYEAARLIQASTGLTDSQAATEKHSDLTVLYHLKGSAAPSATIVFRSALEGTPGPDQDWHWAIVQAKGIPPTPSLSSSPELSAAPPISTTAADASSLPTTP
jgi:hypothetical protein